jgi:hypothetical protein
VTPEILAALKPLVATLPPDRKDEAFQRWDASFRQVQQFLSEEGSREELADEYLDILRDPRNVNRLTLFDLMSFQNVSPVDAVAILEARARVGQIENERQLRSSDGLSYWGFRNLRDFVTYTDPEGKDDLHGDVQFLSFNTPYVLDDLAILNEPLVVDGVGTTTARDVRDLDAANPAVGVKLRLRLGGRWKGGLLAFRDVGEEHFGETLKGFASWQNPGSERLPGAVRNLGASWWLPDKIVVGNYRMALGQGLVLDNTDYFLSRKTGYGYGVRPRSILGDLSRSQEFALRGVAAEKRLGPLHMQGFFSRDKKDGILNRDGSLNKYVVMGPRFENHELRRMQNDDVLYPFGMRRNAFRETLYGGALQGDLWTGTYLGVSGWEARYDRPWYGAVDSVIITAANVGRLQGRDRELYTAYDSRRLGKFRRVFGTEFQTVYENLALQGEYAKLDASPDEGIEGLLSAAPEAYTLNAYLQYEDLNLQVLWRDYDVGFDNPYARGFSEDSRYEQTLVEDAFRVSNPLVSWLAENTPQMKAERGMYVTLRYRVSRNFTISGLEFDDWRREADGQELRRWVARFEYAPIFPLRFRLRQRFSSRGEAIERDFRRFRGWDTRLESIVRLSGYDQLRLLYSTTRTEFAPRPRLTGEPELGLGQAASPSEALQAVLSHNVNDRLLFEFSTEIYDGFLYNFEDNEFIVLDGTGFRNWLLVRTRLSDSLLLRFKLTHDRGLTRNYGEAVEDFGWLATAGGTLDAPRRQTSFRLQLDYAF